MIETRPNMVKDITLGIVLLGGMVTVVVAAELSLPVVAGIGALASVGSGVYQAMTSPKRPVDAHRWHS